MSIAQGQPVPFQVVYVGTPPDDADPIARLQYELAAMPFPLPSRSEIRDALQVLVKLEAGEWPVGADGQRQDISGLPAWLYFLAHADEDAA